MTAPSSASLTSLTATEQKVARLLSLGYDYKRCGSLLGIDERTIETHVYRIAAKLQNPDELSPKMLVTLWAAFQRWTEEHAAREPAA